MAKNKTVSNLSERQLKIVEEYQKAKGLKNFSEAIRDMIDMSIHIAPKSAGEI